MVRIANENMANAIRIITVEQGIDPRDFALVAMGGAGPTHAAEIADAIGMRRVLVPPSPGLASAFGAVAAPLRVDAVRSVHLLDTRVTASELGGLLAELEARAAADFEAQSGGVSPSAVRRSVALRYHGQNYEQDVAVPAGELSSDALAAVFADFARLYEGFYGYRLDGIPIELVRLSVVATGEEPVPSRRPAGGRDGDGATVPPRPVFFPGHDYVETRVVRRSTLASDTELDGPVVVEEMDSTIVVPPGWSLSVLTDGMLEVTRRMSHLDATDPVTLTILNNAFVNVCREMGMTMMRTAYSPIFNEGLDFSCVIFDRHGNMIGQAEFCPAQLGASLFIVRWTIEELGVESFEPGDVVLHNDPYRGGAHLPEHMVIRPVFHEGELFGFVANVGHLAEIGGKAVGSFASDATEVFQEGLRIPPVKIVKGDQPDMELWRLIMANHRTPRNTWGDLNAQIGSLRVAERRLHELLDRYGRDFVDVAAQELMDYSERWMRAEIAAIPDGVYEFSDVMEDDGVVAEPVTLHVTVTVDGERLIVDWTGTSPQVRGPINATFGVTSGATYNAVFHVTDANIPKNSGAYRPISIIAPPGTVANVVYPGPSVGGNTETHPKLADMVVGALAPALPDRVAAAEGGSACNFLFGGVHPKTGDFYANYHLEGCGWGAKSYDDGNDAIIVTNGNCRNTPVEIFETRYPLRTLEYSLIADSGGAGRMRGGLGTRRRMRVEGAEITASALFDRTKPGFGAWSLDGGGKGGRGAIMVKRRGDAGVPHVLRGVRHGVALEVHEHPSRARRRGAHRLARWRRLRRSASARPRAPPA